MSSEVVLDGRQHQINPIGHSDPTDLELHVVLACRKVFLGDLIPELVHLLRQSAFALLVQAIVDADLSCTYDFDGGLVLLFEEVFEFLNGHGPFDV